MKVVGIVIARLGSTRLPGKVLMKLRGQPVLEWVVNALRQTPSINEIIVATSTLPQDDAIVRWCVGNGVPWFQGSETDVLSRFYGAAKFAGGDVVVRTTADCCFLDPYVIEQVIQLRQMTNADYANNTWPPTYADGLDTEAMTFAALEIAHNEAVRASDRECVTTFIARDRDRFKPATLINPLPGGHRERFVLDTWQDFELCQAIAERLPFRDDWSGSHLDILRILDKEPELRQINADHPRNERFFEQLLKEGEPPDSVFFIAPDQAHRGEKAG